jgi:hypothetical protein
MSRHYNVLIAAAAAAVLTSTALIVPTSGALAQGWTTVTHNGQPMVEGSGRIVQQARSVGDFRRIKTYGSEDVEVRFGPTTSLVIAADDNILPLLTSEVDNGTLKLGSRGSFRTRSPIKVWITTPHLEAYQSFGSGRAAIHQVNNNSLRLTLNGSGDLVVTGRTGELDLGVYGSGRARLEGLAARDVKAGMFGSGDATVRATDQLDANVFGSGTLRYVGSPQNVSRQTFGPGRIVAAN